ncbi:MAG: HAD-IIB family hydrolase [Deltaproteobacteria bacterium]|nr:HAD-IIB family hydrolase [Deltaproteobacteria bacterium]
MDLVVFSDLDGTLLDHHTYAWTAAAPALARLQAQCATLVMCSSKTRAEMIPLHRELGLTGPFIAENGGGVYAPAGHAVTSLSPERWRAAGPDWQVLPLGLGIGILRQRFAEFREEFGARGFAQLTADEVARLTGLSPAAAALARQREFNEPVVLPRPDQQEAAFRAAAQARGLAVTRGGRFFHLLGGGDKGAAARRALELFRGLGWRPLSLALGDAENDLPLLAAADHAVLVARPDGSHAAGDLPGLVREPGAGPVGWNRAVNSFLDQVA